MRDREGDLREMGWEEGGLACHAGQGWSSSNFWATVTVTKTHLLLYVCSDVWISVLKRLLAFVLCSDAHTSAARSD